MFNLEPVKGPYFIETDIDGDANGDKEVIEVHICNPVYQKSDLKKSSLVFIRNTETADDELKRESRLTTGSNQFNSVAIQYNDQNEVSGLSLVAGFPSETTNFCKKDTKTPWTVSFDIKCDNTQTKDL